MLRVQWFIARRYLFSRERRALVSVITFISMAGVAVGVAALIVVIGVMDGADELLYGKIADLYPHVRIVPRQAGEPVDDALLARLRARRDVLFAEPVLARQALVRVVDGDANQIAGIQLIGTDVLGPDTLFKLGDMDPARSVRLGERQILPGLPLAAQLRAWPNTQLLVMANNPVSTAVGPIAKTTKMEVIGFFRTNFYDFDAHVAFVSVEEMRRIYQVPPGGYDYIHVKLRQPFDADRVAAELQLPPDRYRVTTWSEENGAFFSALKLEKLGLFIILLLIIFVAAFNIIGTLILMVIEKTREIGILRAVGASSRTVRRIFALDGVMIGLFGTLAGTIIGLTLCAMIPLVKIEMPAAIYNFDHLPVLVKPLTVAIIVMSSMAICSVAALFPAHQAARLNPVEALRYD